MGMQEHTDDLRNVNKGDEVTITTSEGETIEGGCVSRETQRADPRTGEVRETTIWMFDDENNARTLCVNITDGLRSSPDDPEFPQHSELWDPVAEENAGYIESLK